MTCGIEVYWFNNHIEIRRSHDRTLSTMFVLKVMLNGNEQYFETC